MVYIHRQVDANWYEGEHHGRAGIFPTSYVEVCVRLYVSCVHMLCNVVIVDPHSSGSPSILEQIIPPTEKPVPIKSPSVQVLEYGEAVALFNFNADLPVELSFRKVPVPEYSYYYNDHQTTIIIIIMTLFTCSSAL